MKSDEQKRLKWAFFSFYTVCACVDTKNSVKMGGSTLNSQITANQEEPNMAKRTYVPTLARISLQLCKTVTKATPVITRLYPANDALLAALAAANSACALLVEELEAVREYGD